MLDKFIKRAKIIHNNKYGYIKSIYINTDTKIIITCPIHGDFLQTPNNHLHGQGCRKCKNLKLSVDRRKYTAESLIQKANEKYNFKYKYIIQEYINRNQIINIICPKHGLFKQAIHRHLSGIGCKKCRNELKPPLNKLTTEIFILRGNKIHNNFYSYILVDYKDIYTKIKIICPIHGVFEQIPHDHLGGKGCSKCFVNKSKICGKWLDDIGIPLKNREILVRTKNKKYFVDGYDTITNTVYEFNGDFWHGNPQIYNLDDINPVNNKSFKELYYNTIEKQTQLMSAGFKVITIWENDFKNK